MGLKKHKTSKTGPWKDGPKPKRKVPKREEFRYADLPRTASQEDIARLRAAGEYREAKPLDSVFGGALGLPTPGKAAPLPTQPADTHTGRKQRPGARGFLFYFPDAILEAANVSRVGNEQHNAGQPIHWAFDKSTDHADCIVRHLIDFDEGDSDALDHAGKVLWRAGALYQTLLEKRDPELHARREAQRARAAKGER